MPDDVAKPSRPLPAPVGEDLIRLTRSGTDSDRVLLSRFSPEQLAGAVVELAPDQRVEFLEGSEQVAEIVPLLPETEFTTTIRGTGIEDAGWLVEFASSEQRVAAVDLDCWKDFRLSPRRLFEWIDAMIAAGPETLVAAFHELDPELWVVALQEMADFFVGADDEACDGLTDDGFVYYSPHTGDDEDRVREILTTARLDSPSHYWRFVYAATFESRARCAEDAAHWQRGRLNDLGFPDRDRAMRAYRPLPVDAVPMTGDLPSPVRNADAAAFPLPEGPMGAVVGRALRELSPERAAVVFRDVLAVANTLAVADELPLADSGSVHVSLEKALRGIERGLAEVAAARDRALASVLDEVHPLDLFRVGATLDAGLRRNRSVADLEAEEERSDWDVETEVIDEEDRTLGPLGRPQGTPTGRGRV